MNQKQFNIIYFHGLDSGLSDEKLTILKKFGDVTAPTYDYRATGTLEAIKANFIETVENTVVIGSSYGGYVAYNLSRAHDLPALLFNPALPYRSIHNQEAAGASEIQNLTYIVLGQNDDVIKCNDNQNFIAGNIKGPCELVVESAMAHRIPTDIFEKHVNKFFMMLKNTAVKSG